MKPTHIQIEKPSQGRFSRHVHGKLASSKIRGLIDKLRPANTGMIDLALSGDFDEELERVIRFLKQNGIPKRDISIVWPGPSPTKVLKDATKGSLESLKIRLGSDVAERDSKLNEYFISTSTYHYVSNDDRHIVVGPKGAGKTAILNYMRLKNPNSITVTPEYYATDLLNTIEKESLSNELNVYITTWKYSILVEIMQNVVSTRKHSPAVKSIRNYLQENQLLSDEKVSIFERFLSYLQRFTKLSGGIAGNEFAVEISEENDPQGLFRMTELLEQIPNIRSALRNNPIHIYIDELDQSWDNSATSNNFLIALFTAALQIRGYDENLHIFVFLRSEIFDLLKANMPQLDKFRTDIVEISWAAPNLRHLIGARIRNSLGYPDLDKRVPNKMLLDEIFRDDRDELRCGAFEYLLSRTTYRPREVIQIATLALEAAERNLEDRVTSQYILQAEEQFSIWKMEHIVSENMYILPGLDDLLEELRGSSCIIPIENMQSLIAKFVIEAQTSGSCPSWLSDVENENEVIDLLYGCEVIGVEKLSKEKDDEILWGNYDFHYARPKAKTHMSLTFMIHPSLWRSLEVINPQ